MRRTALLLAALAVLLLVALPAAQDWWAFRAFLTDNAGRAPTAVDTLARLDTAMRESSGLVVSRRHPGVYWTHNDSGDRPRLYAFDTTGAPLRTFEVGGATAVDWEDMDAGPCPVADEDGAPCLYLGDIGDNGRGRPDLAVYVVREPDPASAPDTLPLVGRVRYAYPDEPHDAELLAVTAAGDLVVVTKGRTGTIVLFELPAAAVRAAAAADTVVVLPVGRTLPIPPDPGLGRMVTGGSFRPDGTELAVRTYTEVYFFRWPMGPGAPTVAHRCLLGRVDDGGEALAYADARTLVLTSEATRSGPGTLTRVACP